MKQYKAFIDIMPHQELLDPQGKTVTKNIHQLNISGVADVRIGKHIEMVLEAVDLRSAEETVEIACKKLLTNLITEKYHFRVEEN